MKLRIRGNTLRLRLTRSEVEAIGAGKTVVELTEFPDGTTLSYRLVPGAELSARQSMTGHVFDIAVEIPHTAASVWAASDDEVSFNSEGAVQVDQLAILIEKDFTCITPREGEEEIDTYPNPNAATG